MNKDKNEKIPLSFLEELPIPDITVAATEGSEGSNEYLIDCSPEIIQYWDKHNILPYDGKKNIRYYRSQDISCRSTGSCKSIVKFW